MTHAYYQDDKVTLYHGDCREITEWLVADVLVTDPPYGKRWGQHGAYNRGTMRVGIANDASTTVRDAALEMWGAARPAAVFGDFTLAPAGTVQTLIFRKPSDAGIFGARGGWRRDAEAIYLLGRWPAPPVARSGVLTTRAAMGTYTHVGHSHVKPLDVMEQLLDPCPPGVIADPFAGSGSTLVAARNLGRQAIGVELEERYCETVALRLAQDCLDLGDAS